MNLFELDSDLRKSVITVLNDETKTQIGQCPDRDDSKINDIFLQDADESQYVDIKPIEDLFKQEDEKIQQLTQQKTELELKIIEQKEEIKNLEVKLQNANLKSPERNRQQAELNNKQQTYQQLLKQYEQFSTQQAKEQIGQAYGQYKEKQKRNQQNKVNNENTQQIESELQQQYNNALHEFDQIQDVLKKREEYINLEAQQEKKFISEEEYMRNLQTQKNNLEQNLEQLREENEKFKTFLDRKRQLNDNIFITYNRQRREIKDLTQECIQKKQIKQISSIKVRTSRLNLKNILFPKNTTIGDYVANFCGIITFLILLLLVLSQRDVEYISSFNE